MATLKPEFRELTADDFAAIIAIGREQALLMDALQQALEASDDLRALGVARKLVGLEQQLKKD